MEWLTECRPYEDAVDSAHSTAPLLTFSLFSRSYLINRQLVAEGLFGQLHIRILINKVVNRPFAGKQEHRLTVSIISQGCAAGYQQFVHYLFRRSRIYPPHDLEFR